MAAEPGTAAASGRGWRRLIGQTVAPPRFLAVLVVLPLAALLHRAQFPGLAWTRSLVIGFDLSAAAFLASLLPLLRDHEPAAIRAHAEANNANRLVVLLVTTLLMLVVMAAIAGELAAARNGNLAAAALLIGTLVLAWTFANSVFSLHYAHEFYSLHPDGAGDCGGLDFPGTAEPGYIDFAYFAFTLGMTFQTSDVAMTRSRVRGVAILHSFAAFVFNIGVIAFTINALGGGG